MYVITCENCGKQVEVSQPHTRFCPECRYVTKTCTVCGKEFVTRRIYNKQTCSRKCGLELSRQKRKGRPKINISESEACTSLCWSCAKAYALPEPDGCSWIRNGVKVWNKVNVKTDSGKNQNGNNAILVYCVTDCNNYKPTAENEKPDFAKCLKEVIGW